MCMRSGSDSDIGTSGSWTDSGTCARGAGLRSKLMVELRTGECDDEPGEVSVAARAWDAGMGAALIAGSEVSL